MPDRCASPEVKASAAPIQRAHVLGLAPLPAEVPPLSLNLHPTPDMHKLKGMLLSTGDGDSTMSVTSEKSKVGALGMGGIGKSVVAKVLVQSPEVRRSFSKICWVFSSNLSY